MATRQYIGARYVPKFVGEWNNQTAYESLSIVIHNNASYTSKKQVPAGVLPTNTEYWVQTGSYNGFIQQLQQEIDDVEESVSDLSTEVEKVTNVGYVTPEQFGAVGDGETDDTNAIKLAVATGKPVLMSKDYKITDTINLAQNYIVCTGHIIAVACTPFKITNREGTYIFNTIEGHEGVSGIEIDVPPSSTARAITAQNYISFRSIYGFANGIYLHTSVTNKGIQYNTIEFGVIEHCTDCIKGLASTGCWINSNTFRGNRLGGDVTHCVNLTAIDREGINGNIFDGIGYEGTSGDAIVLIGCNDNMFRDCRMAESMGGTYWINMDKCFRNEFNGCMQISAQQVRDNDTFGIGASDSRDFATYFPNKFSGGMLLVGPDTWVSGTGEPTYSYCGIYFSAEAYRGTRQFGHNWINSGATTFDIEALCGADAGDRALFGNGFKCIITPGSTLIMPRWFTGLMTEFVLHIWGAGNVTIKDKYNNNLGTITAPSGGALMRCIWSSNGINYHQVTATT